MRDFVESSGEIAVFIEIADDRFGNFAHRFRADANAQLPGQMIGEA